jgi:anti-sigma regulatory factor (Ser/Thr protein kinase)
MEVIEGGFHTEFPMEDASRVGEARRHAARLALECGLPELEAGRLAIVVTELATNLVRHASRGRMLIGGQPEQREVEVLAVDHGPGIADVERSLDDGYSTGGTPGTGLGAVRRLATTFDLHSTQPGGTLVLARVRAEGVRSPASSLCAAAISVPKPGERVCGDAWAFALDGSRAAVLVADGLGHGPDAAEASAAAVEAFRTEPFMAPRLLLERLHARLRPTRGAAISLMQADEDAGTIRMAGAGNVVGRLVTGLEDRTLLTQHGTAGISIRTPDEVSVPWPAHALLVLCSDGVETRWKPELLRPVLGRDPALAAALLLREHGRGRDDATVAVLRRRD